MTLPRLLLALMLLTATAAAQDKDTGEGLVIAPRSVSEGAAVVRRAGLAAQAAEGTPLSRRPHVDVRLYGGWRQLWGGDVNEGVANSTILTVSSLNEGYYPLEDDEVAAIDRGTEFGADVVIRLTPRFGLVGGVGWIESSEERLVEIPARGPLRASEQTSSLELRSVPARFGVQYSYPLGRRLSLLLEGGAGLYFTRLRWSDRAVWDGTRITHLQSETSGYDLGLHGGIALDIGLSDRFGLMVGVQGIHADIGGLEGFREGTYTYRPPTRDDGTLKVVHFEGSPDFPILVVGAGTRTMDRYGGFADEEEASVGLGGLRYTGGLRISF